MSTCNGWKTRAKIEQKCSAMEDVQSRPHSVHSTYSQRTEDAASALGNHAEVGYYQTSPLYAVYFAVKLVLWNGTVAFYCCYLAEMLCILIADLKT